jgi:hypothetical protein
MQIRERKSRDYRRRGSDRSSAAPRRREVIGFCGTAFRRFTPEGLALAANEN